MTRPPALHALVARMRSALRPQRSPLSHGAPRHPEWSEDGDSLVEVLIALVVLGITVVAMLFAFWAALSGSAEHRTLTNISTAQKSVTQQIAAQLENANPPLYLSCAPVSAYQSGGSNPVSFTSLPNGYSAQISGVSYWNAAFSFTTNQAQCVANTPQLISATVTYPNGANSVVTTVVNNPTPKSLSPAGRRGPLGLRHPAAGRAEWSEPQPAAGHRGGGQQRQSHHE